MFISALMPFLMRDTDYPRYSKLPNAGKSVDGPIPPHEPDGYWSGNKEDRYGQPSDPTIYAEGVEAIVELCDNNAKYPFKSANSAMGSFIIQDRTDLEPLIKDGTTGLINDLGDHYIRYFPLNQPHEYKDLIGIFAVRCGDCGKIAQGIYKGNPDMGDFAYQILHRKNWFCQHFMWTYMGGHGYSGGRRMICPDCSNEYATGKRRVPK